MPIVVFSFILFPGKRV